MTVWRRSTTAFAFDFRPSVNALLLLTADVYVAPVATIMRGLDTLHVDQEMIRDAVWEGQQVYVVERKRATQPRIKCGLTAITCGSSASSRAQNRRPHHAQ